MLLVYLIVNGNNAKFPMKVDQDAQSIYVTTFERGGDRVVIHNDAFTDHPTTKVYVVMHNDAFTDNPTTKLYAVIPNDAFTDYPRTKVCNYT